MLDEVMARIAGRFMRVEPRRAARAFLTGLLSDVERKNCWWLAEHAGHRGPQAMQRLLRQAVWDADRVRDDVRDIVPVLLRDGERLFDDVPEFHAEAVETSTSPLATHIVYKIT